MRTMAQKPWPMAAKRRIGRRPNASMDHADATVTPSCESDPKAAQHAAIGMARGASARPGSRHCIKHLHDLDPDSEFVRDVRVRKDVLEDGAAVEHDRVDSW